MNTKETGILGEKIASDYLKKKGYQILDKNYSLRIPGSPLKGEIDIIAKPQKKIFDDPWGKKENTIHFIEVKTLRDPDSLIEPEEKINLEKQKKLVKVAESWLMQKKFPLDSKWQIDVISIKINEKEKRARIRHLKNVISF